MLLALLAGAVMVGATGTWTTLGVVTRGGAEEDGPLVLVMAAGGLILSALQVLRRSWWLSLAATLVFGTILGTGVSDWLDVTEKVPAQMEPSIGSQPEVGWGLVLVTVAAALASTLSLGQAGYAALKAIERRTAPP